MINNKISRLQEERVSQFDPKKRKELGQYMTPATIASLMVSAFDEYLDKEELLDAGAGAGMLSGAYIEGLIRRGKKHNINVSAYEIDREMLSLLETTKDICLENSVGSNISLEYRILARDFIADAVQLLQQGSSKKYDKAILNPPYKKIRAKGVENALLNSLDMETSNLYAAFVMLSIALLKPAGELVAILPRSFCNGVYFKNFRNYLLNNCSLEKIYTFAKRAGIFQDVLQENVIIHIKKGVPQARLIEIHNYQTGNSLEDRSTYKCPVEDIIPSGNPAKFIHIITNEQELSLSRSISSLPNSLSSMGLGISTGQIVDFRSRAAISKRKDGISAKNVPLLFTENIRDVRVQNLGKDQAFINKELISENQINKMGHYVLIRRISSKEEKRRLISSVLEPEFFQARYIAFDNKLNFIHANREPLPKYLALGIWAYLSSSIVDSFFRQMNGHTQVNATDIRVLRFPSREMLIEIGQSIQEKYRELSQRQIDDYILDIVFPALKVG